jgi:hypothetical protein
MKVMVERLNLILRKMVGLQQNGFLRGRSIENNTQKARLTLERAKEKGRKERGLLLLNFKKAYDRMDKDFIWKFIKKMGFLNEAI